MPILKNTPMPRPGAKPVASTAPMLKPVTRPQVSGVMPKPPIAAVRTGDRLAKNQAAKAARAKMLAERRAAAGKPPIAAGGPPSGPIMQPPGIPAPGAGGAFTPPRGGAVPGASGPIMQPPGIPAPGAGGAFTPPRGGAVPGASGPRPILQSQEQAGPGFGPGPFSSQPGQMGQQNMRQADQDYPGSGGGQASGPGPFTPRQQPFSPAGGMGQFSPEQMTNMAEEYLRSTGRESYLPAGGGAGGGGGGGGGGGEAGGYPAIRTGDRLAKWEAARAEREAELAARRATIEEGGAIRTGDRLAKNEAAQAERQAMLAARREAAGQTPAAAGQTAPPADFFPGIPEATRQVWWNNSQNTTGGVSGTGQMPTPAAPAPPAGPPQIDEGPPRDDTGGDEAPIDASQIMGFLGSNPEANGGAGGNWEHLMRGTDPGWTSAEAVQQLLTSWNVYTPEQIQMVMTWLERNPPRAWSGQSNNK